MTHEILRVTPTGDFVWHEDADKLIEESDFTNSPAMQHILRTLRKQRTWVDLTDEQIEQLEQDTCAMEFPETVRAIEAKLKEKNI